MKLPPRKTHPYSNPAVSASLNRFYSVINFKMEFCSECRHTEGQADVIHVTWHGPLIFYWTLYSLELFLSQQRIRSAEKDSVLVCDIPGCYFNSLKYFYVLFNYSWYWERGKTKEKKNNKGFILQDELNIFLIASYNYSLSLLPHIKLAELKQVFTVYSI